MVIHPDEKKRLKDVIDFFLFFEDFFNIVCFFKKKNNSQPLHQSNQQSPFLNRLVNFHLKHYKNQCVVKLVREFFFQTFFFRIITVDKKKKKTRYV